MLGEAEKSQDLLSTTCRARTAGGITQPKSRRLRTGGSLVWVEIGGPETQRHQCPRTGGYGSSSSLSGHTGCFQSFHKEIVIFQTQVYEGRGWNVKWPSLAVVLSCSAQVMKLLCLCHHLLGGDYWACPAPGGYGCMWTDVSKSALKMVVYFM